MEITNLWYLSFQIIRRLKSISNLLIFIGFIGIQCIGDTSIASYPTDPTADIEWPYSSESKVTDIQTRFNTARANENAMMETSIPMLSLPSQGEWDGMIDAEKALWLINRERIDRGVDPLHGLESNVMAVAQNYAQYLMDNNAFSHYADGQTPWDRLDSNPAIGACHDFLGVAENLAVLWGGWPLPVERSIYRWMYDDSGSGWGHRHAILWYPYNDNSGHSGMEGFLGIGRASGTHSGYPNSDIIVMNIFDPCQSWQYETGTDPLDIDNDGDGYTENQGDCDDTDASINPGAAEICGDSVDQDCSGADLVCPDDGDDGVSDGLLLYNPEDARFFLKNDLSGGVADTKFNFGPSNAGWNILTGDWNGNGQTTVGLYNPDQSKFYLKNSHSGGAADIKFVFGPAFMNWIPVTGDWNGNGQCGIGLYNPVDGTFRLKNANNGGTADEKFRFGPSNAGWQPISGDWDGDGVDTIGLYSPKNGTFYLKNTFIGGSADVKVGFGPRGTNWKPVCGDWDGDGITEIGLFNPITSSFYLKNTHSGGTADIKFNFGPAGSGWIPLSGNWE